MTTKFSLFPSATPIAADTAVGLHGGDCSQFTFTAITTLIAATTKTLTNTTFDTAGTGNSFSINGVAASANTGIGAVARATSPTFVTPTLGVASATSLNKITVTAPATGATLTLADGKTFTVSNTLTFTGTDSSSVAFGAGGTVAYTGNNLSAFAATTSAQLAGIMSDETGSGALVFGTSPTLTTPVISSITNSGTITLPTGTKTLATTVQADCGFSFGISTVANQDYTIILKAPHGGLISDIAGKSASGTCTATFKIEGVAITTGAVSVTSTESAVTPTGAATFVAGDTISVTCSANSSCLDANFSIKYSRTLA